MHVHVHAGHKYMHIDICGPVEHMYNHVYMYNLLYIIICIMASVLTSMGPERRGPHPVPLGRQAE